MAYDDKLWVPADLPGAVMLPEPPLELTPQGRDYIDRLYQVLNRQQAQLSRVVKILDRFRVIVDADKPSATGSNLIWIDTANDAIYYDKPGSPDAWTELGGGSDPWTYVKLASDFTSSLTANTAVTGLNFAPAANQTYVIEGCFLLRTATATVGARPGCSWPTGYSDGAAWVGAPNSYTAFASRFIPAGTTQNAASTGLAATTNSHLGQLWATLVMGASPSGNFQITLASETAGTNVTMKAGSWIRYRTI